MGCVSSKSDINDQHPNIFQVSNVNDHGDLVSPGQLEVTETELVLYQRGKNPTIWPLRSLRKYGFDLEIFSFECGRRCPTGQGIYAFRCHKAEQLFNIVQQHIARNSDETTQGDFPLPIASTGPPVRRRVHSSLSRPESLTSNGPLSPTAEEYNNNKRDSLEQEHSYSNSGVIAEEATLNYANLEVVGSPTSTVQPAELESPCHLYMNVDTNNAKEIMSEEEPKHCYANIDTKDIDHLRPLLKNIDAASPSVPPTPTSLYITVHEVNYAELDLEQSKNNTKTTEITPDSPKKTKKSYATIDFQRTNALSQSINPPIEVEEGSRKTRHNSTFTDITSTLSD